MRFYTTPHRYYCGIDLHARRMYICVLDAEGQIRVHRNGPATPEHFLTTIAAYREDLVVAVECIFTWYWLADLCAQEGIAFVLGHADAVPGVGNLAERRQQILARRVLDVREQFGALAREVATAAQKVPGRPHHPRIHVVRFRIRRL